MEQFTTDHAKLARLAFQMRLDAETMRRKASDLGLHFAAADVVTSALHSSLSAQLDAVEHTLRAIEQHAESNTTSND